ncbi:MAG: hypothetical protein KC441_18385 [Anaerolineales bacterium]|nr:hypothetical protein [Anaerolineales bacterium]
MAKAIGRKTWALAEGYLPDWSNGPEPQMVSHGAVCLLNTTDTPAHVELTIYYSEREPAGPYRITVPAERTRHVRFNNLEDPEVIPRDTDFATVITSDVPIVVQHTRLDSRQAENGLMTTIAYGE